MPTELVDRVVPVLGFLLSITVVAELADRARLFDQIARWAARVARGRVRRLWLLVVALTSVVVAVLSLDTAAVLLTPILISLARRVRLRPLVFAWTTVWLANTASLFLPVSNLTNLIALGRLRIATAPFVGLLGLPALAAVLVTAGLLWVLFQADLRSASGSEPPPADPIEVPSRAMLVWSAIVCAALVPTLAAGVKVTLAAAVAALLLAVGSLVWQPRALSPRMVPWLLILGVAVLFVVIELVQHVGLTDRLLAAAGTGEGWWSLLRLAATGAVAANVINNLPAYLALEPAAASPVRTAALLIGVNTGPLITPWASLATVLWAQRCRAAGVRIPWGRFALFGVGAVACLLPACVTALWVARLWAVR